MSAVPKPMSLDEFIVWEERQEQRYEFDGVTVEAMTGGTWNHGGIQSNLIAALHPRLRGGPCRVVGEIVKIRTANSVRYPDAMVICAPVEGRATWTSEPTIIFEILSPSTARKDLGAKNAEYQMLETLRRYIVLHQNVAAAEVFFRDEENGWQHEFIVADGLLALPEIGVTLPLAECYEGIDLSSSNGGRD